MEHVLSIHSHQVIVVVIANHLAAGEGAVSAGARQCINQKSINRGRNLHIGLRAMSNGIACHFRRSLGMILPLRNELDRTLRHSDDPTCKLRILTGPGGNSRANVPVVEPAWRRAKPVAYLSQYEQIDDRPSESRPT